MSGMLDFFTVSRARPRGEQQSPQGFAGTSVSRSTCMARRAGDLLLMDDPIPDLANLGGGERFALRLARSAYLYALEVLSLSRPRGTQHPSVPKDTLAMATSMGSVGLCRRRSARLAQEVDRTRGQVTMRSTTRGTVQRGA